MTTSDDARSIAALRARAERGTPRGAGAVLDAARRPGTVRPFDGAPAVRSRRRLVATAAAIAVLTIGAGAALVVLADRPGDEGVLAGGRSYCTALAAPVDSGRPPGDIVVYLEPGAGSDRRGQLADDLRRDPRVAQASEVDEAATYDRFRELFAGEPDVLEMIDPSDLPTSIGLHLVDTSEAASMAEELRSRTEVFEALEEGDAVRVLDVLVWPATAGRLGEGGGIPDLGLHRYGPTGWAPIAAELRATAPPVVAADLAVLLDRLERGPDLDGAPMPTLAATQAAASAVRSDAAARCDLEAAAGLAEPSTSSEGETTATEGRSGG